MDVGALETEERMERKRNERWKRNVQRQRKRIQRRRNLSHTKEEAKERKDTKEKVKDKDVSCVLTQTTGAKNSRQEVKAWLVRKTSKRISKDNGIRSGIRMMKVLLL